MQKLVLVERDGYKWQVGIDGGDNIWVDAFTLDDDTLITYLKTENSCSLKQVQI